MELPGLEELVVLGNPTWVQGSTMFKITTIQSVVAVAAAAFLAGTAVLLTTVAPPANAMPGTDLMSDSLSRVHQLAPAIIVSACSASGWPYYDQSCLRRSPGDVRQVRVINLETRGPHALAPKHGFHYMRASPVAARAPSDQAHEVAPPDTRPFY